MIGRTSEALGADPGSARAVRGMLAAVPLSNLVRGRDAAAGRDGMERDQPVAFGELLTRYRRAAELTQEALAERAGLSVHGISALERGVNRSPQRETVR